MIDPMTITPAQCRAARALIGIRQQDIADSTGISLRTIASFELGENKTNKVNLIAIQRALESAGVEFTEAGGVQPAKAP